MSRASPEGKGAEASKGRVCPGDRTCRVGLEGKARGTKESEGSPCWVAGCHRAADGPGKEPGPHPTGRKWKQQRCVSKEAALSGVMLGNISLAAVWDFTYQRGFRLILSFDKARQFLFPPQLSPWC